MRGWLYVLACVLVPLAWGILSTLALRWVERRFSRRARPPREADEEAQEPMWDI
jgi:hypothetical protein